MSNEVQRPTGDRDRAGWRAYWTVQGMLWRTEPEVNEERKRYLVGRQAVKPNIEQGIYPFRDEHGGVRLTRADIEYLLVTQEGGHWLTDWSYGEGSGPRHGLDLRGADLRGQDLRRLPLMKLRGGLYLEAWWDSTSPQREAAAVHLEDAHLMAADLRRATLRAAHLEGANLYGTQLSGAVFQDAHLGGADLRTTVMDGLTGLLAAELADAKRGSALMADIYWGGCNPGGARWSQVARLGDEMRARTARRGQRTSPVEETQLEQLESAVRANRQLSNLLRSQGLNEDADRFSYRAQVLQRVVLRRRHKFVQAFGSWLLDLISGYGYKPLRSLIAYVLIICLFSGAYLLNAQFAAPHLTWDESVVLSISSFHGRGFFTSGVSLGDTLARLAAGEAIIGLLIEITFIATFTQRFFAR